MNKKEYLKSLNKKVTLYAQWGACFFDTVKKSFVWTSSDINSQGIPMDKFSMFNSESSCTNASMKLTLKDSFGGWHRPYHMKAINRHQNFEKIKENWIKKVKEDMERVFG